jgi:hypothetical protein
VKQAKQDVDIRSGAISGQESGYNVPFRTSIECKVLETMHMSKTELKERKNILGKTRFINCKLLLTCAP